MAASWRSQRRRVGQERAEARWVLQLHGAAEERTEQGWATTSRWRDAGGSAGQNEARDVESFAPKIMVDKGEIVSLHVVERT